MPKLETLLKTILTYEIRLRSHLTTLVCYIFQIISEFSIEFFKYG